MTPTSAAAWATVLLCTSAFAQTPQLALLVSHPGERTSALVFTPGDGSAGREVATFSHLPWAPERGALLPGTRTAVVVTQQVRVGDGSFSSVLLRLEPGVEPRVLTTGVFYATAPLVTASGRVFVERGEPGPEPEPEGGEPGGAALRVDSLHVDEVNPQTGETRTVHLWTGYTAHLAGAWGSALILYRVSFHHADLVAVDMDSGAVKVLVPELPPFARDFSVDPARGVLVFQNLSSPPAPGSAARWAVEELELATGRLRVLASAEEAAFAPSVWPGGKVVWNANGRGGFVLEGRRVLPDGSDLGVDVLRATSRDGKWVAVVHTGEDTLPRPFVVSSDLTRVVPVKVGPGLRGEVLGFVEGGRR